MVWIHGGAYTSGAGAIYQGEDLARKGVVVVTINYRLGVFGFLAHPELTAESPNHSSGNYALMVGSVAIWGLGFASTNSMQQVRLVGAAPALASASVSLNTSVLYVGQAVGSAVGGLLYARDLVHAAGYVAAVFVALALTMVILTRPKLV